MQAHASPKWLRSRFPMSRSQHGAGCSSFDVAKDSNIARSRSSKKHANRSMPISTTANTWQNAGENGRWKDEKRWLPGVPGRMGISFSVAFCQVFAVVEIGIEHTWQ